MSAQATVGLWFSEPGFLRPDQVGVDVFGDRFGAYLHRWPRPAHGRAAADPARGDDFAAVHRHREFVETAPGFGAEVECGVLRCASPQMRAPEDATAEEVHDHYQRVAGRVGVFRAGENGIGVWVTGLLDPGRRHDDASWRLWGDWRSVNGRPTLLAVLAAPKTGDPVIS